MALVFQDSFDCWGSGSTSRTNMLNSSNMWISIPVPSYTNFGCTTTVYRTGTHSFSAQAGVLGGDQGALFSLGGTKTNASSYFGVGFALRVSQLPGVDAMVCCFVDISGVQQYTIFVTSTGTVAVGKGNSLSTILGSSASGIITPNVFHHYEIKHKVPSTNSATDGELYIKINGTQVVGITGVDFCVTTNTSTTYIEKVGMLPSNAAHSSNFSTSYIDDLYVWDSTGSYCNDWIGNKACYVFYCDADTATAQWSITGTTQGFDAINDTTPDADSTYLAATSAGVTSIFELPTVNSSLTGISAVTVHSAIRQDSSGVSEIQVALGNSAYTNGTSRVAPFPGGTSTTYTVYQDHFYQDPDGAGNLTPSIVSALKLKLMRTV